MKQNTAIDMTRPATPCRHRSRIRPAANAAVAADPPSLSPVSFSVARTVHDVLDAWKLVYRSYLQRQLIEPNVHGVYAVSQARSAGSKVLIGRGDQGINCTLTVIADGPEGLPLESVYPVEIAYARRTSVSIVEVGLLADRGEAACSFQDMRDLMRLGFFAAWHARADLLIGVHPRHAPFYCRYWAFDVIGPTRSYARVRHHPVVPLRLNARKALRDRRRARGIAYTGENFVTAGFYERAFDFDWLNSPAPDADAVAGRQALALAC